MPFNTQVQLYKRNSPNIVIDDDLMNEAMKLSRLKTKKAAVETGLKLLVQIKKQERIKSLRGKLRWDGDLDAMRMDQLFQRYSHVADRLA